MLGAIALGLALTIRPGDVGFYPATLGVAAIWVVGALASGPLHLGRARTRAGGTSRSVLQAFILGALLLAIFLAGAVVVGRIPALRAPVDALLAHARFGSLLVVAVITAINGVAEELFFRGALFAAIPQRLRVGLSAALYALATVFSGVLLLVVRRRRARPAHRAAAPGHRRRSRADRDPPDLVARDVVRPALGPGCWELR